MKLSKASNNDEWYVGQFLAPFTLLSITLLSHIFGNRFYNIYPAALLFCIPIVSVLVLFRESYNNKQKIFYNKLKQKSVKEPYENSAYHWLIYAEEHLFLVIYTISDFICSFDLAIILFSLIDLHLPPLVLNSLLFSIATIYTVAMNVYLRKPQMNNMYGIIHNFINTKNLPPLEQYLKKLFTIISIYGLLWASVALVSSNILLTCSLLLASAFIIYHHLQDFFQFHYAAYLLFFAHNHCNHFTNLMRLFLGKINIPYIVPKAVHAIVTPSIAILYTGAYAFSVVRTEQLQEMVKNDSKP